MINRSDIDLVGVSTCGENIGSGIGIYKCKNTTGNTLQLKSISVTGSSLSIVATGDTIIISGGSTGGGLPVLTGMTDYVLRVNSTGTGIVSSSILDSGSTNVRICKNNIILGSGGTTHARIEAFGARKMDIVASSGINIGDLSNCLFVAGTPDGMTLCSAAYCDLLVHAGTAVSSGQVGKTLRLSGGDGQGAAGGNVILTGGTGSVGGNIILSTSNSGKVQITNLPAKTTETCGIFINASGCLSTGVVGSGNTTIIGGTANRIPVFNSIGNNIQNTTIAFTGNTLYSTRDLVLGVPNGKSLYLNGSNSGTGINTIILGASGMSASVGESRIISCGLSNNINISLFARGSGYAFLYAPTVFLGNNGTGGLKYTLADSTLTFPYVGRICSCNADQYTSDAKSMNIYGGCGYGAVGYAGSGATVNICAGNAASGIVGTPKAGGNVQLKAGSGICGGANGRIILSGLPAKTTESCVVYVDSTGKLSTGVSSGGTGGLSVAITGATNGVCAYNTKNVCLGGQLTSPVVITASGSTKSLTFCSYTETTTNFNRISICNGTFTSTAFDIPNSLCTYISNGGNQAVLYAQNVANTCSNQIAVRSDAVYVTVGGASSGLQYSGDYCTKMNANVRVIPDVGWVKRYTIGGWSNIINGSTIMGCCTAASGITICQNTFFGVCAGRTANNVGVGNVGIGFNALQVNTSGCWNTAVGTCALIANTTGNFNTALGNQALPANTSGSQNTAVGNTVLTLNSTGTNNVGIGSSILAANTVGYQNIGIGNSVLGANVGGYQNVAIGNTMLASNTSGYQNVAIGMQVLHLNTTGNNNIGIGRSALFSNTTGCANVAIGCQTMFCNTTGFDNVAIGCMAMMCSVSGMRNIAIGTYAMYCNGTGMANIALGFQTLQSNTNGNFNIALGQGVLASNSFGNENIGMGYQALYKNTTGLNNTAIGSQAMLCNVGGNYNIALGSYAMTCGTGGDCNIGIGLFTLCRTTTGTDNIGIGTYALRNVTTGGNNIGIGKAALYYNNGINNIAIGNGALCVNVTGTDNIGIGYLALCKNTSVQNIAIGCKAMSEGTSAAANIAIGMETLTNDLTGNANVAIGYQSQMFRSSGIYNVSLGNQTLYYNANGSNNTAIGDCALFCNGGSENTALGVCAGHANITGSRNVFIGRNGGQTETGSDKLHIANCYQCSLICGDFVAKTVCINNCLYVNSVTCPSDCRLKSNISAISIAPITAEYKQYNHCDSPNKVSVGMVAQELCETHPDLVSVDEKGYLGINYGELHSLEIAYLKCEVKELRSIITELKGKLG